MLYNTEDFKEAVRRMYTYLQVAAVNQPHSLKPDKPMHMKALEGFIGRLPDTAGIQFVWDFLIFQFYIYSSQTHQNKPTPSWFLGKEAWKRWEEYDEGARYYSRAWAAEKKYRNPVKNNEYRKVSDAILRKERLIYSRQSGPNFCFMKYGVEAYDPADFEMCVQCPFERDCMVLAEENHAGVAVVDRLTPVVEIEIPVRVRQKQYGTERDM